MAVVVVIVSDIFSRAVCSQNQIRNPARRRVRMIWASIDGQARHEQKAGGAYECPQMHSDVDRRDAATWLFPWHPEEHAARCTSSAISTMSIPEKSATRPMPLRATSADSAVHPGGRPLIRWPPIRRIHFQGVVDAVLAAAAHAVSDHAAQGGMDRLKARHRELLI